MFLFVQAIAIFSQNFTVLVLIFGPKMYKVFLGQADPSGGNVAGRGNNPRFSLTNRPAAVGGERRTSLISAGRGRRTESADGDGSTQFFHPLSVTFEDDIGLTQLELEALESAGKTMSDEAALDQFRRIPGDKASSFRHSTEVWTGKSVPTDGSEVSALSNHASRTESIKEELQPERDDDPKREDLQEADPVKETPNVDDKRSDTSSTHTSERDGD